MGQAVATKNGPDRLDILGYVTYLKGTPEQAAQQVPGLARRARRPQFVIATLKGYFTAPAHRSWTGVFLCQVLHGFCRQQQDRG